jgi:hypothetical protein
MERGKTQEWRWESKGLDGGKMGIERNCMGK